MNQETNFAVIFDMDGVLVDSTKYIWESFNILVKPMGIHFNDAAIRKYLGNSLGDQVLMWKNDYGVDVRDVGAFSIEAQKIQMRLMGVNTEPDMDLLRLLQELKERNIAMGVGTSSFRTRAESMLSVFGIDHYFDALVTAEDVSEHKPNPHIFLEVAKQLNVSPENCVVIEDAAVGIDAAKNGNMKSIGFLTEWNSREELGKADKIIKGFQELSYQELITHVFSKKFDIYNSNMLK